MGHRVRIHDSGSSMPPTGSRGIRSSYSLSIVLSQMFFLVGRTIMTADTRIHLPVLVLPLVDEPAGTDR
jgi:hypothetical protein